MAVNQDPERVKAAAALLLAARSATLATLHTGWPHAALVTPALDDDAQPLLLLSSLAVHTRHLQENAACALLITGPATTKNPQTAPRLCLSGEARIIEAGLVRERFLQAHPYAAQYVDFSDFEFWKIFVNKLQYIGGFANAAYLDFSALQHEISALTHAGYG